MSKLKLLLFIALVTIGAQHASSSVISPDPTPACKPHSPIC